MTLSPSHTSPHGTPLRSLACDILSRLEDQGRYLDALLDAALATPDLSGPDKRLLTEIVTGVTRYRLYLDTVLQERYHPGLRNAPPSVKSALRMAAYQMLFLDKVPDFAAVDASVALVRPQHGGRAAGAVNATLRSLQRNPPPPPDQIHTPDPMMTLAIQYSHPRWMVRHWYKRYGADACRALMQANNTRPGLSLRVSPFKTSAAELCYTLEKAGLTPLPGHLDPDCLLLQNAGPVAALPGFAQGLFIVQDQAAALAARLSGARPGMRVLDLCAAPGGKAVVMAWLMQGRGRVTAVDLNGSRLERMAQTVARTGLQDVIELRQDDACTFTGTDLYDVVLADAPCSGLGVIARKPDIKWKRMPQDIARLSALQGALLANAATLVRPGGHVVYTTCTIEPEENREVVTGFLESHPHFSLAPAGDLLPAQALSPDGYLETLPHVHGADGAFGARLLRTQ